ncbi:FAD-dependent oxidoreductase [Mongoliimonas terrestris]|uniref:FAD-dependent oxidoreductase n=1 Tax=Mongoliimonas terrestris TaxID=1709001 RepID=UPI00094994D6|nr:FAD-dependent oxidoreductase [Mongoliimonas terrestris]
MASTRTSFVHPTVDLAVLGAGVMGLVTALTARRAGLSVAVFDRAADFTAGAGWRSGGMLAPECEAEVSSPSVVALGRRSMALWPALADVALNGTLVVAPPRDPAALARFARVTASHRAADAAAVADLESAFEGRFRQGLFYPTEGHLDPRATLTALLARLRDDGVPVTFAWTGTPEDLPAATLVDARGLGARDRLPMLRGVKGEMALIRSRDVTLTRPVRLLHHRHPLYVVPRADGVFMIGATTVESDDGDTVSVRSAGELLTQAYALHPAFGEADILEFNAGLRPAMPDNEPVIRRFGRTLAVNGLYRHGWLLAPALAETVVAVAIHDTEPEAACASS